jgi:hypothetical protein
MIPVLTLSRLKIVPMCVILGLFFQSLTFGQKPASSGSPDSSPWLLNSDTSRVLHYTAEDSLLVEQFKAQTRQAQTEIAHFFDTAWSHSFDIYLFPNRAALDRQWQQDWQAPDFHSECWMVASGVGHRLDLLSPRVWNTEACEHDPSDSLELPKLLAHELTHVFHGQHSPVPTFDGLDSIGWFVEGLAVLVSGQLDSVRQAKAEEAVQSGLVPASLNTMWSGRYRYAVCGSLVKYVDQTYGRATIRRLLACTTQNQILTVLGLSAEELIDRWKSDIRK